MSTSPLHGVRVGVAGGNRSTGYASRWLSTLGVELVAPGAGEVDIVAGGVDVPVSQRPRVTLWDFQVGLPGTGYQASAISGVSWVIGLPGRPPLALQADVPEKWCGLLGATLALASLLGERGHAPIDVSAADILRAFADQNAGNHLEIPGGWHRNGRLAVEHGGIFPQGFYACRDGYVGIVARSRADWTAVLGAIGDPDWSHDEAMRDPFRLAADDSVVGPLFAASLASFTRDELLARAVDSGATLAPVFTVAEIEARSLVRQPKAAPDRASLPFEFVPWSDVPESSSPVTGV